MYSAEVYSNYNYTFTIHLLYMYTNYTIPSLAVDDVFGHAELFIGDNGVYPERRTYSLPGKLGYEDLQKLRCIQQDRWLKKIVTM